MKKFIRVLVPLLLAVLIIASIGWYLFTYDRGFTRDFLLTQARYNDLHGNSRLSSWFYDLAYNFSNHDENVAIELANLYKADGNYTKAEYTLTNAINSDPQRRAVHRSVQDLCGAGQAAGRRLSAGQDHEPGNQGRDRGAAP